MIKDNDNMRGIMSCSKCILALSHLAYHPCTYIAVMYLYTIYDVKMFW